MKQLYLIRHCEAEGQAPEANLTPRGMEQAQMLALFLAEFSIDHVVSSPFQRAQASIAPFCKRNNLDLTIDERLSEWVLSSKNLPDWRERLEEAFQNPDLSFPGGETGNAARKRGEELLQEVLTGEKRSIAVVSHGGLMVLLLQSFVPRFGYQEWAQLTNPDVFRVTYSGDGRIVERIWKS